MRRVFHFLFHHYSATEVASFVRVFLMSFLSWLLLPILDYNRDTRWPVKQTP